MSKEQIAWCRTVGETLARTGGGRPVPALAFQHIIVPEVYNTFTQVRDKGVEGAFEGRGVGAGRWYTADAPAVTGELLEAPCPPDYSNGQFAAWLAAGDVRAVSYTHLLVEVQAFAMILTYAARRRRPLASALF